MVRDVIKMLRVVWVYVMWTCSRQELYWSLFLLMTVILIFGSILKLLSENKQEVKAKYRKAFIFIFFID